MRRQFNTVRLPAFDGSQRSAELGHALAQRLDPETLEALLDIFSLLTRVGGQVFIAPYRVRVNPQTGAQVGDGDPGVYVTRGYLFHYDHLGKLVPKLEVREPDASPEEPLALPELSLEQVGKLAEAMGLDIPESPEKEFVASNGAELVSVPDSDEEPPDQAA